MGCRLYFALLLALCSWVSTASANSYLEMITKEPENLRSSPVSDSYFDGLNVKTNSLQAKSALWYDSRITTPSPVVFSSYPKYLAWQRAEARKNNYEFDAHESIQQIIEGAATGVALWGIYQLYRYD